MISNTPQVLPALLCGSLMTWCCSFLYRNLIRHKDETDPAQLAMVVEYMRKQVQHMDQLDSEHLTTTGKIKLLPFSYDC